MKISAAVVTISDRRSKGTETDESGNILETLLQKKSINVKSRNVIADDMRTISEKLRALCDNKKIDLVITTGGTGFTPRDNTPEATLSVLERLTPGIDEALRGRSLEITPFAMLSRGVSGIRGKTLIINLPGSPNAVREQMDILLPVLPHAIQMVKGLNTDNHEYNACNDSGDNENEDEH